MPRPLRFIPECALVEITTRTLQGRLLLKPSPELTDIILGTIGNHAFAFLSMLSHFLLSPFSPGQRALFMQFVNANVAKGTGRLHLWRECLWSRRYRAIVVADEKAAHGRLRYVKHMSRPRVHSCRSKTTHLTSRQEVGAIHTLRVR